MNFLEKLKSSIKQHKYAYFILSLILIVVFGMVVSEYLSTTRYSGDTEGPLDEDQLSDEDSGYDYNNLPAEQENLIEPSLEEYKSKLDYPEVVVESSFSDQELNRINSSSFIYRFISGRASDLSQSIGLENAPETFNNTLRFEASISSSEFINSYINYLNRNTSNMNFGYDLVNRESFIDAGFHLEEVSTEGAPTHRVYTYRITLNNYYVDFVDSNSSFVVIYEDINAGTSRVDLPNFVPASTSDTQRLIFTEDTYNLTPTLPESPNWDEWKINSVDPNLNESDFNAGSGTGTLIYAVVLEEGLIMPLISKRGVLQGERFNSLESREFYLSDLAL